MSDPTLSIPIISLVFAAALVIMYSFKSLIVNSGNALQNAPPLLLLWGITSYFLFWLPGAGIVQHGWVQLGADR